MELKDKSGRQFFINDEETYKNYLENEIMALQEKSKTETLTNEEIEKASELMNMYNQIVDFQREMANESENYTPRM